LFFFFFQAEDGIRDATVTGVQTCALPIYFFVKRIVGVFRDKAAVRLHGRNAALLGEVGSFFEVRDACGAGVAGNEADGERAVVEIPDFAARPADNQRSGLELMLVERAAKRRGILRIKIADENLAG